MVTQLGLQDNDLVLWVQLLAERLNADMLERLHAEHPDLRYSHGFLFQQLVDGPRPVGEVAANLGVTSQAVSKSAGELERLGYVERAPDRTDARVRRIGLTARGLAAVQAARDIRAAINAELSQALGQRTVRSAARALLAALDARGAMSEVGGRRLRPAQGLSGERR